MMVTLSCAGNRRGEFTKLNKDVMGHGFKENAIGNVIFKGVKLLDLLKDMGLDLDKIKDKHLIAESMDTDPIGNCFTVSTPMSRILDPSNEVIIAYEMNGEPLP